jgi:GNAT superfamily N-acetyltransferase
MRPRARKSRVALRPLTRDDLQEAAWLDQATLDPDGDRVAISRDGDLVGVMEYSVGVPEEGWLGFGFVAVEPQLRGLGLDSEAVRLVEEDALGRGVASRFWTRVPHSDGLGLYLWLRLGYRPVRTEEKRHWPEGTIGGMIAMVRIPGDRR